jgi:hypothetical protein
MGAEMSPPNGLPFSGAQSRASWHSAENHALKCLRSRGAERVRCNGVFGEPASRRDCHPHKRTTPAWYHTARRASHLYHTPHATTRRITSSNLNHIRIRSGSARRVDCITSARTTPSTTGSQHNGHSYHLSTTGTCTTETEETGILGQAIQPARKGLPTTLPGCRTGCRLAAPHR